MTPERTSVSKKWSSAGRFFTTAHTIQKGYQVHGFEGFQIGVNLDDDRKRFTVTDDGVVVVPKGSCLSHSDEAHEPSHVMVHDDGR